MNQNKYEKRKRILFLVESLSGGGAEKVLNTIIEHIDTALFDVCVCCISDVGPYVDGIRERVKYHPVIPQSKGCIQALWANIKYKLIYNWLPMSWVYRLFIPKGYDVEIAFCEGYATKLLAHSSSKQAKHIAWVHCNIKDFPWPVQIGVFKDNAEERNAYAMYDEVIAVSETARQGFIEIHGLKEKIKTIYNPLDREDILRKSKESTQKKNRHPFRFISVGRLTPAKGYDRLVEACKLLISEGFHFELWILGQGAEEQNLKKQISDARLEDIVLLKGFHKNPYKYMAQCDCFICSSRSEGYSLVIAEAMCIGLPIVSTRCAGPEEILNYGEYGLIADNSTNGIYAGMRDVLYNGVEFLKIASQKCSIQFDIDNTMSKLYTVL